MVEPNNGPDVEERQKPKVYRAEDVRQGEIVLRTPLMRWIFIGGLVAAVIVAALLAFLGR